MHYNDGFMTRFELNQRVGNYKTNEVGTIASKAFKGASGEFKGYLVRVEKKRDEIWDEGSMVLLPKILKKKTGRPGPKRAPVKPRFRALKVL
jgi:hypothetical protein